MCYCKQQYRHHHHSNEGNVFRPAVKAFGGEECNGLGRADGWRENKRGFGREE